MTVVIIWSTDMLKGSYSARIDRDNAKSRKLSNDETDRTEMLLGEEFFDERNLDSTIPIKYAGHSYSHSSLAPIGDTN